jgi:hypothetical protein
MPPEWISDRQPNRTVPRRLGIVLGVAGALATIGALVDNNSAGRGEHLSVGPLPITRAEADIDVSLIGGTMVAGGLTIVFQRNRRR